jgi:hypothetical protein
LDAWDALRVSTASPHRRHRVSERRVSDEIIPFLCLMILIVLTVLGSTLGLFYWFAAALSSSSTMLCPDLAPCIVERAGAEAGCHAEDAGCSVTGEAIRQPATEAVTITP